MMFASPYILSRSAQTYLLWRGSVFSSSGGRWRHKRHVSCSACINTLMGGQRACGESYTVSDTYLHEASRSAVKRMLDG